jgi:hypothetical protein
MPLEKKTTEMGKMCFEKKNVGKKKTKKKIV